MFSCTAQVSHQVCQFFLSVLCHLVRVTMVDKNKVVVCCLLATLAIMWSEKKKRKRKIWSKKWYLIRNISCDAHLLNELLETDVPWDDAIVVSAGKLRKLWDSLSELRSSVCERRLERTVLRPALLPVKTAQFTQFFPSGESSHRKIAQFNWECMGCYTVYVKTKKSREQSCYMSVRDTHRPLASNPANRRTWMVPRPFLRLFPVSYRGANSI